MMDFKQGMKKAWTATIMQMGKLGEQKHLAALRDGFALLIPVIVAASVGIIIYTFVFGGFDTTSTSILGWITWGIPNQVTIDDQGVVHFVQGSVAQQISNFGATIFFSIWQGIFNYLTVFVTLTISYSLARIRKVENTFMASLVGLGTLLILSYGDSSLLGTTGLLLGIISSLVGIELYAIFERNPKLKLKMPNGVPPAVARSFSKLFPTMLTLILIVIFQAPFIILNYVGIGNAPGTTFSVGQAIRSGIQAPFLGITNSKYGSYSIGFIYVFFINVLWFFGLHGANVLNGIFLPILLAGIPRNVQYVAAGGIHNHLGLTPTILADGTNQSFVYFGGAGMTLGLILIGLFISKRRAEREVLKFAIGPGIFNINEPILFGLPMVLNFGYLVPFIMTHVVLFTTTWLAIEELKIVPPVIVRIPFTTPVLIGGFLGTSSWQGIVLALMNFVIGTLIWTPFVIWKTVTAKKTGEELVKINYHMAAKKFVNFFNKKNKNIAMKRVNNE